MVRSLLLAASVVAWSGASAQVHEGRELVQAALVADADAAVPGSTLRVGLHLRQAPGWHTYWEYPGDSGMATRIRWQLPEGFEAGPIRWPVPERIIEPGDLEVYAYRDEVLLVTEIRVPTARSGDRVKLRAQASWLVCEAICIPGGASLELDLPVASKAAPAHRELFERFRAREPSTAPPPFSMEWSRQGSELQIEVSGVPPDSQLDWFPLPGAVVLAGHPVVETNGDRRRIRIPVDDPTVEQMGGVLKLTAPDGMVRAWRIGGTEPASHSREAEPQPEPGGLRHGLWRYVLYGFLGGLLMNVMPCVLPVLALKIYGFLEQAGHSRARVFQLGVAFSTGVFVWFLGLAVLVVGFQSAGRSLNWSFQFQHPPFIATMLVICLLFGLNLAGAFELFLPAGANAWLARVTGHGGVGGAFLHGLFATLLGSACTAPLLAPAIGFALSQTTPVVFAIFGAAAAGMALPYFLLSANPGWMRFLPRPGPWMVRMKQAMGVLVLLTAAWLGWILWNQLTARPDDFTSRLERALAGGHPVFVDFTADWCINCKVNERTVLQSREVRDAFAARGVELVVADWTRGDPAITAKLREHGRAGVPFYLFYPQGGRSKPVVLPELLTRRIVLDSLSKIPSTP